MSTRSYIALRLREEDKNKSFKAACGLTVNASGSKYLYVYCHFDGYPEGVGADLKNLEMTYDDALEFILKGDRSTCEKSYWERRKEKCPPHTIDYPEDLTERYVYVLEEVEEGGPLHVICIDRKLKTAEAI